jgi:hypothetical protein
MPGAQRPGGHRLPLIALVVLVGLVTFAAAGAGSVRRATAPTLAFELDRKAALAATPSTLAAFKAAGIDTVIAAPSAWTARGRARLESLARVAGLTVVEPRRSTSRTELRCRSAGGTVHRCAVLAGSVAQAQRLAASGRVDYVIVHVTSLDHLAALRSARAGSRLVAVLSLPRNGLSRPAAWKAAVAAAVAAGSPGIGVAGLSRSSAVSSYLTLLHQTLQSSGAAPADWGHHGHHHGRGGTPGSGGRPGGSGGGGGSGGTTTPAPPTTTPTTTPTPPPSGGAASVFLSPNGSDSAPCTQAQPCRSLNRGYQAAASGGATVQLADGLYGCDGIRTPSKTGTVVFRPASGAHPATTCELNIDANNVEFDDMALAGLRSDNAQNVTLHNVDITCKDQSPYKLWGGKCSAGLFLFAPASNFTMTGGSIGPTWDDSYDKAPGQSQIGINLVGGSAVSRNIVLDGVHVHDDRRIDDQQHTSCMMLGGGDGVTIRNSSFTGCAVFDLFVTWWNFVSPQYPPGTNIRLENNSFGSIVPGCSGCTKGFFSVEFADYPPVWQNVTISGNKTPVPMNFDGKHSNFVVSGNTMPQASNTCRKDITYSNNTVTGSRCGSTDKVVSSLP